MEKKKISLNNLLENDVSLRIISIILAVITWFVLSVTYFPKIQKNIVDVPVTLSLDNNSFAEKGLSPINFKDTKVEVTITGPNYEIGNYSKSDLTATVNVDTVTKAGTYDLNIEVKSNHSADDCDIVSVYPNKIPVTFDAVITNEVPITVNAPNISAKDGFVLQEINVSPSSIKLEGSQSQIDKIVRGVVKIDDKKTIDTDYSASSEKITFYDKDDNEVEVDPSAYSETKYQIECAVYKKKTLNIEVGFSDCPKNFDIKSLPFKQSVSSIEVLTPNLSSDNKQTITVGNISLSAVNLESAYTFDIPLSAGEINQSGVDKVFVTFNPKGYSSVEFTIENSQINIKNSPLNKEVTLETQKISKVLLYGPSDIISKINAKDLSGEIDLSSNAVANGSYSKEVVITAKDYNNVWCFGKYEASVTVSDPQTDDEKKSDSTNS